MRAAQHAATRCNTLQHTATQMCKCTATHLHKMSPEEVDCQKTYIGFLGVLCFEREKHDSSIACRHVMSSIACPHVDRMSTCVHIVVSTCVHIVVSTCVHIVVSTCVHIVVSTCVHIVVSTCVHHRRRHRRCTHVDMCTSMYTCRRRHVHSVIVIVDVVDMCTSSTTSSSTMSSTYV